MRSGFTIMAVLLFAIAGSAEPPPLTEFTQPATYLGVNISPSGQYLAASIYEPETDTYRFRIIDRESRESVRGFSLGENRRVAGFDWTSDTNILIQRAERFRGTDIYRPLPGRMSMNVATRNKPIDLAGGRIIDLMPYDEDHVMIDSGSRYMEVHKMDVKSDSRQKLAKAVNPRSPIDLMIPDAEGNIKYAVSLASDLSTELHEKLPADEWRLAASTPFMGKGWQIISHGWKPEEYFTRDNRQGKTAALGRYNVEDGSHEIMMQLPGVDFTRIIRDYDNRVIGAKFDHHFPSTHFLSDKHPLAATYGVLQRQFPNDNIDFISFSRDHKFAIVLISADRKPGDYYLVDTVAPAIELLGQVRPNLTPDQLGATNPFEFAARDGTVLSGYITSAKNTPMPGPMVVMPHGTPFVSRDYWAYNRAAQILATRGYHVLQVNYRGSNGFGADFVKAGFRELGDDIQKDIIDATRWSVGANVADPERICIYGNSWGGYSALMSSALEPDLYKCAIAYNAQSDLTLFLRTGQQRETEIGEKYFEQTIGRTPEFLARHSPVNFAQNIKAKVMFVHGGQNRDVPLLHAQRMRDALRENGQEVEWLVEGEQGSAFRGSETLRNMWEHQLAFLSSHLAQN